MARFTSGYIKLHRKLIDSDIGSNLTCLGLWVSLLCMATWKESKIIWEGKQRVLPPGSVVIGLRSLSEKLGCSKDTVSHWLAYLRQTDRVTVEHSPRGTVVTICNWETYQARDEDGQTQTRHSLDTNQTQTGHGAPPLQGHKPTLSEEEKKIKKENPPTPNQLTKKEGLSECIAAYGETLRVFGIQKDPRMDDHQILRLIALHNSAEKVKLALVGARHEAGTDTFKPKDHFSLMRLMKPDVFEKCVNLGARHGAGATAEKTEMEEFKREMQEYKAQHGIK